MKKYFLFCLILLLQNVYAENYNILGISKNYPKEKQLALDNWRNKIIKLANSNKETIFINGSTEKKMVALTFDDGPDTIVTPAVLDILKKYNVKATFFFIGKQIEENKEVVLRAFKEGHLVLNHSWNHSRFSTISKKDIMQEVETTEKILDKYIGKRPLLMRVPYGDINDIGLQQLKDLKYKLIFWSLDTLDWFEKTKDAIVEKVISNVRPGEIILMHSNSDKGATAEALSTIINVLKDRGYSFTTIDNFVNN